MIRQAKHLIVSCRDLEEALFADPNLNKEELFSWLDYTKKCCRTGIVQLIDKDSFQHDDSNIKRAIKKLVKARKFLLYFGDWRYVQDDQE